MGAALALKAAVKLLTAKKKREVSRGGQTVAESLLKKNAECYFFDQNSKERKYLLSLIRKTANQSQIQLGTQLWDTVDIDTASHIQTQISQQLLKLQVKFPPCKEDLEAKKSPAELEEASTLEMTRYVVVY